jgi:hypothetical protein
MSRRAAADRQRRAGTNELGNGPDASRRRQASTDGASLDRPSPNADWTRYRPRCHPALLAITLVLLAAWIVFLIWMAM